MEMVGVHHAGSSRNGTERETARGRDPCTDGDEDKVKGSARERSRSSRSQSNRRRPYVYETRPSSVPGRIVLDVVV